MEKIKFFHEWNLLNEQKHLLLFKVLPFYSPLCCYDLHHFSYYSIPTITHTSPGSTRLLAMRSSYPLIINTNKCTVNAFVPCCMAPFQWWYLVGKCFCSISLQCSQSFVRLVSQWWAPLHVGSDSWRWLLFLRSPFTPRTILSDEWAILRKSTWN